MGERSGGQPAAKRHVLVITPFGEADWRWLADYVPSDRFTWTFRNGNLFGRREHVWLPYAIKALRHVKDYDLVVSHHPYMTLWVAFAMRLLGITKPHLAFSFNHGNKRFFQGVRLYIAKRVLPEVAHFWVYSNSERELFHRLYDIPVEKQSFSHWAVTPPDYDPELPEDLKRLQPYISCLGRNNRDYRTFFAAMAETPANAVVVCSPQSIQGLSVPPNVTVLQNIPLKEAMTILHGALFNVVPIQDASTGAGHMTIVNAMQYGKAQLLTDVSTVRDYFRGGEHGLWVDLHSVESMRIGIARLLEDVAFRERCERNALEFAEQWFSEAAAGRVLCAALDAWGEGKAFDLAPPNWNSE